jgi:uncharacterized membrane protein YhiD involved in acid resistance
LLLNQDLSQFLANESLQVQLPQFFFNLILSGVLAWALALVYRRYGTALSNRDSFSRNFVLLAMTTTVIIAVVKSSLALSLGLVGALSIVRFRSAIKDPEELTYLFFTIAIGLGLGASQWAVTLGAFVIIAPTLVMRSYFSQKRQPQHLILSVTSFEPAALNLDQMTEVLDRHCTGINLKRLDETAELLEATFIVHLQSAQALSLLKQDLRALSPSVKLTFLDQKQVI